MRRYLGVGLGDNRGGIFVLLLLLYCSCAQVHGRGVGVGRRGSEGEVDKVRDEGGKTHGRNKVLVCLRVCVR